MTFCHSDFVFLSSFVLSHSAFRYPFSASFLQKRESNVRNSSTIPAFKRGEGHECTLSRPLLSTHDFQEHRLERLAHNADLVDLDTIANKPACHLRQQFLIVHLQFHAAVLQYEIRSDA